MTAHHFTFQITDESDASDIREVETRAFGFSKEADLTASLLEDESARPALSLLARHEGKAGLVYYSRSELAAAPVVQNFITIKKGRR